MVKLTITILAILCSISVAFTVQKPTTIRTLPTSSKATATTTLKAAIELDVDDLGNNLAVKEFLIKAEETGLLSKVASSGLLSKAQAAGITLSSLEPLLYLASENPDVLVLVESAGPELLPLLPTIVDLAPPLLPILGAAVGVPTPIIGGAGLAALGAAGLAVVSIPDDTVVQVAIQTLAVGLALPVAGASFAGAFILGQLKS